MSKWIDLPSNFWSSTCTECVIQSPIVLLIFFFSLIHLCQVPALKSDSYRNPHVN